MLGTDAEHKLLAEWDHARKHTNVELRCKTFKGCPKTVQFAMPAKRKKPLAALLDFITQRAQALTALLLVSGLVWLLLLPLGERRVKMDEKSLMVGAAVPTLR